MTEHHDDDGHSLVLTDEDRQHIAAEIDTYNAELLTTHDLAVIRELGRRKRHLAAELQAGQRLPLETQEDRYDFEIVPRRAELGGGWRLYLLDNGVEVGGGVFPVAANAPAAHAWWDTLDREQRQHWSSKAMSTEPVTIHLAYRLEDAWFNATDAAGEWLDSRGTGVITGNG
jgi:hypothetical protein